LYRVTVYPDTREQIAALPADALAAYAELHARARTDTMGRSASERRQLAGGYNKRAAGHEY
jgi:hypothetical protein